MGRGVHPESLVQSGHFLPPGYPEKVPLFTPKISNPRLGLHKTELGTGGEEACDRKQPGTPDSKGQCPQTWL